MGDRYAAFNPCRFVYPEPMLIPLWYGSAFMRPAIAPGTYSMFFRLAKEDMDKKEKRCAIQSR
jgi:hypothetical protein